MNENTNETQTNGQEETTGTGIWMSRRGALKIAGAGALLGVGVQSAKAGVSVEETSVVEGDIAEIGISASTGDNFTLTIGDANEDGYEVQVEIDPGTGGSMTLEMNTFHTADGDPDNIFSLSGGTILHVETVSGSAGFVVAPGRYQIEASRDGSAIARRQLEITPRETGDITVWTAPNADNIDDSSLFSGGISGSPFTERNLIAIGDTAERSDTISPGDAYGDWLVIEFSATGIFGLLESKSYGNVDEMVVDGYFELIIENTAGQELTKEALDMTSLYYDASAEKVYAVADTDDLTVERAGEFSETVGEAYQVQFILTEQFTQLFDAPEEVVETGFDLIDRQFEFDGANGTLEIEGERNERLPARTTVAPDTEIEFFADGGLVVESTEATVDNAGNIDVTFDFSAAEEGDEILIEVQDQGFENNAEIVAVLSEEQPETDDGEIDIRDWRPRGDITAEPDEELVAEILIENTGQRERTAVVELEIAGQSVAGDELTIGGNTEDVAVIEYSAPGQLGEYEWQLRTADDETEPQLLTVEGHDDHGGEAEFEILHVEPTTDSVTVGDTVDVDVIIGNSGNAEGTKEVIVIFSQQREVVELTLDAGHDDLIRVSFEAQEQGEIEVAAETEDDTFVANPITVSESDGETDDSQEGGAGETDEDPSGEEVADDREEHDDTADEPTTEESATEDDDGLFSEGLLLAGGGVAAAAAAAGYAIKKRGLGGFGGESGPDERPPGDGQPGQTARGQHEAQPPAGQPQQPPRQNPPAGQQGNQHQHGPAGRQEPHPQPQQQPPGQQPPQQPPPQQPPDQQQPPAYDRQPQQPTDHQQAPQQPRQNEPPSQPPAQQPQNQQPTAPPHNQPPNEYEEWRPPADHQEYQEPPESPPDSGHEPPHPPVEESPVPEESQQDTPEQQGETKRE